MGNPVPVGLCGPKPKPRTNVRTDKVTLSVKPIDRPTDGGFLGKSHFQKLYDNHCMAKLQPRRSRTWSAGAGQLGRSSGHTTTSGNISISLHNNTTECTLIPSIDRT